MPTQESNFVEFVILSNRVFILETEIADYAYINCNESDQGGRHKNGCTDTVGTWNEPPSETKKTYKHHTNTAGVGCLAERLLGDWAGQKNYGGNFSFLILGIDRDSKLNVSSYHRYIHEQLVVQSLCND